LKKHSLSKIYLTISLIIFALIFIVPVAHAAKSEDNAPDNTITAFNETPDHSDQQAELKDPSENNGNTPSSAPELCISLSDKLKWFFSFETPDFIDDLYDNRDDFNYRAFVGFHIVL
jgi:hypothetical protein